MVTDGSMACVIEAEYDGRTIWVVFDKERSEYYCSNWRIGKWYPYKGSPIDMTWNSPEILCKGLGQW